MKRIALLRKGGVVVNAKQEFVLLFVFGEKFLGARNSVSKVVHCEVVMGSNCPS